MLFVQVMIPNNYTRFLNDLTYLIENKRIPMSRIDDAVKRILRVKFALGLFENPYADTILSNHIGSQVFFPLSSYILTIDQFLKCNQLRY